MSHHGENLPLWLCQILSVSLVVCLTTGTSEFFKSAREEKIQILGDVIFGGLFPMHEKGQHGDSCGNIKKEKGIQRLEAMLYAVDMINNNDNILPNLTIGVHILDTCSYDTYALEQSMDFIKAQLSSIDLTEFQCQDGMPPISAPLRPVAGVIGAASSPVSIMVANILRLFKIPQISYASTSIDLSDETRFEYFSRVVPPDSYQAQAMVDIAKALGWNYVITVADEGNYGEKGIGAFEEKAKKSGVCVAHSFEIPLSVTEDTFDKLIKEMFEVDKARAVVMFVNEDNSRGLLQAFLKSNRSQDFAFLASDSWGKKIHPVHKQEQAAEGAVTLLPKRVVVPGFDNYFLQLNPIQNRRNPWFKEYWEVTFNCTFENKPKVDHCTGLETFAGRNIVYEQEGLVQFVIDSVYALAHAMDAMLSAKCKREKSLQTCVNHMTSMAGEDLLHYIRNVSFTGVGGNLVHFDMNGDGLSGYDIFQFKKKDEGSYEYELVGEWTDGLFLNASLLRWKGTSGTHPKSVCSDPCKFGHAKSTRGDSCCWVCIKCGDYEYLENESTCTKCPEGHKPDPTKSSCIRLPVLHLEWDSLWAIFPVAFSSLGMMCTIFVLLVFIRYNKTPVIMASGRELCYILLLGIFLSYGMSFVILARPSIIICTAKRVGLGVSLCLIYAAMLTKTNRIYRIFNRGVKAMVKRPSYTSPKSQIVICLCLVSVQTVGGITWLGFEVPDTLLVSQGKDAVVLKCKASQIAVVISLFYNILLIIFCTVYAFKTRKIPQNFNEAKYIAFTMYSTCIVWLAFIPIYFGANNDFKIERTSLCMCVSISAAVALACLFAPKVYIVLFQPHKNVRQVNNNSSTTQKSTSRPQFARTQNKFETCVTYNGSVVSSEIQRSPENVFQDSFEDSSFDEGVAMQTPST